MRVFILLRLFQGKTYWITVCLHDSFYYQMCNYLSHDISNIPEVSSSKTCSAVWDLCNTESIQSGLKNLKLLMHKEVWKKHSLAGVNTQLVWKALGQLRREDMINAHVPFWMMNVHQKCKKKKKHVILFHILFIFIYWMPTVWAYAFKTMHRKQSLHLAHVCRNLKHELSAVWWVITRWLADWERNPMNC